MANCGCNNPSCCGECSTCLGCPVLLDTECVIYHKNNSTPSGLQDGLGLSNGATLDLVLETISGKIEEMNVPDWTLTHLRVFGLINTFEQFGVAVDQRLKAQAYFLGNFTSDPSAENGQYWFRTDATQLRIKLNDAVRIITIT